MKTVKANRVKTRLQPLEWKVEQNLRRLLQFLSQKKAAASNQLSEKDPSSLQPSELNAEQVGGVRLLLSVSGGMDSCVLLRVFSQICVRYPVLTDHIGVAYIHHGPHADPLVVESRDRAQNLVKGLAHKSGFRFETQTARLSLGDSEDDLRRFRRQALMDLQKSGQYSPYDFIVLAHHQDDLLETRLIRLIRGTGPQGLASMKTWSPPFFRPFLAISKKEIQNYAIQNSLHWEEDPTNSQTQHHLRNWLRHCWLKDLETYRPGALDALRRSLDLLVEDHRLHRQVLLQQREQEQLAQQEQGQEKNDIYRWSRRVFMECSSARQQSLLSEGMQSLQKAHYTFSQIQEVLKRLKPRQYRKRYQFVVGGVCWSVTPEFIQAELTLKTDLDIEKA